MNNEQVNYTFIRTIDLTLFKKLNENLKLHILTKTMKLKQSNFFKQKSNFSSPTKVEDKKVESSKTNGFIINMFYSNTKMRWDDKELTWNFYFG